MISASEIREIVKYCVFKPEEIENGKPKDIEPILVEGLVRNYGFHPKRLKEKESRLKEIIAELNPTFFEGWSFLNLPFDKDSKHWGEHPDAEALFVLCAGLGLARSQFPRDLWDALPGGVPYIIFERPELVH